MIYNDILERTGASSATISRVNRSLQYGADGYQAVLPRIKEKLGVLYHLLLYSLTASTICSVIASSSTFSSLIFVTSSACCTWM